MAQPLNNGLLLQHKMLFLLRQRNIVFVVIKQILCDLECGWNVSLVINVVARHYNIPVP